MGRSPRATYCSDKCKNEKHRLELKEQTVQKMRKPIICQGCGIEFIRSHPGKRLFCSANCKRKHYANKYGRASEWTRIEKAYGINKKVWEQLLSDQNGECVICLIKLGSPCVDHDHGTGLVRGLLCRKCNQAIGLMMDSPENLMRAARYLS